MPVVAVPILPCSVDLTSLTLFSARWLVMVSRLRLAGDREAKRALLIAFEEMVRRVKEEGVARAESGSTTCGSDQPASSFQLSFLVEPVQFQPSPDGCPIVERLTFKLPHERT